MAKKESTKQQVNNKTPELAAAKKALEAYLKDHKLDPEKDWSKDKNHGKKVTELINKLNKERDKAAAKFPESDPKTMKHLEKLAKHEIISKEKKMKKSKHMAEEAAAAKAEKSEKKEKKSATAKKSTKYDYPLIDGREMTSAEKKKYRMEQRKLAAGDQPKEKKAKKEAPAKEEAKAPKKEKAAKKASKEKAEKPSKEKKEKKSKKAKKEED